MRLNRSMRRFRARALSFAHRSPLLRWLNPRQHPSRFLILVLSFSTILLSLILYLETAGPAVTFYDPHNAAGALPNRRPPHIPLKIWQIYLSANANFIAKNYVFSWIIRSPAVSYTLLDASGADEILTRLTAVPGYANARDLYYAMPRRVLRGDFLRYLVLAMEGGIYSDLDTRLLRPLEEWVPEEYKDRTRLIVGIEIDEKVPLKQTIYELQFCQWTIASAQGHPMLWTMVDRILDRVQRRVAADPYGLDGWRDDDVLDITGPEGWSTVMYQHLSDITGTTVTWKNLTGLKEPRLFNDTLILPYDAFRHTYVKHMFQGSWKKNRN